jgi:hypothetical protein
MVIEEAGIYGYLDYTMAFWYICNMVIWEFSGILVHFDAFWYIVSRKLWQPWPKFDDVTDKQTDKG